MEIRCLEITQNNQKMYIAALPAKELIDDNRVKVDIYNAGNEKGYQRRPSHPRAVDFAKYIQKANGICPTSILLNIRGEIKEFSPINGNFGILTLPDTTELWIVDGQHRIEGLKELIHKDTSFSIFPVTVVLMKMSSSYEEAKQFIIINKTQKGIRSDLGERFIAQLAKREGAIDLLNLPRATTIDISWRPKATDIVDILNKRNSADTQDDFYGNPWLEKMQLPNEPKAGTLVSQKAFEDSLKHILHNPSFASYSADEISRILVRYWRAILELCAGAAIKPSDYVLQKTTGVNTLHNILPRVLAISSKGNNKLTIERLKSVLHNMAEGMNELFWENNGMAGNIGTSKKSFSILTAKLLDYLEEGNQDSNGQNNKPFEL